MEFTLFLFSMGVIFSSIIFFLLRSDGDFDHRPQSIASLKPDTNGIVVGTISVSESCLWDGTEYAYFGI